MRKLILKWLFGEDVTTYSELLNKYAKSIDDHEDTLNWLESTIDRYENNVKYTAMLKVKINELEKRINKQ